MLSIPARDPMLPAIQAMVSFFPGSLVHAVRIADIKKMQPRLWFTVCLLSNCRECGESKLTNLDCSS